MLLIWDLHINSRVKDRVVDTIRKYVLDNPDEKNIIFLGDYVYHFSYDRSALLYLYTLFLELFSQWKNVYILAWNHDWIGNTFVFEEAKRTYEMITNNFVSNDKWWKIEFITKPKLENIEWEDVLFLPYFLEIDELLSSWAKSKDIKLYSSTGSEWQISEIETTIKTLSESSKKNEFISAKVNQILLDYIKKYSKLTVIHHYYIEWVNFPWQRWRFYFNDIAISKLFCDLENIKMISGHLHQWFVYKNYLCTGSVWNTSPLEVNHIKMLFKYSNNIAKWNMIFVNPYFLIDKMSSWEESKDINLDSSTDSEWQKLQIDEKFVDDFVLDTIEQNKKNYDWSDIWDVEFDEKVVLNKKDISVSIKVEDMDYDKIYDYIDQELYKKLKDVKLKKNLVVTKDLFEKMDLEGKNLTQWFSDWKNLLKDYLKNKYPDENEKYLDFLKKEKIL
jgi:uncharacterized protein YggL (DUF469 family)